MNELLSPGQVVRTHLSKEDCCVEKFLGGGGQGEVYRAKLAGESVALKWYYHDSATAEQKAGLDALIKKGSPHDNFLWPLDLARAKDVRDFGYVMALREPRFKSIVDLMLRRCEPSYRALVKAGLNLAHSFLQLHTKGWCYKDISHGNVFFDPETGDVLICDNDNVAIDGGATGGVAGTPRFMAPEIVRGEARPSTQTDLYSLAVLLFHMFMIHHPLDGANEAKIKCMDRPAMDKIYGTDPIFIFDPDDDSNRPVAGLHDNALECWAVYPRFLRDLFIKAFTVGLRDPHNGRVRESEWRKAMDQLRDSIVYCGKCGAENFYDSAELKESGGEPGACWHCRVKLRLPARIRIGGSVVMLNHDTELFPHHVDDQRRWDFSEPVATVSQNPKDPNVWGLKNVSADKWDVTSSDGAVSEVPAGSAVRLGVGKKINFGKATGEIRV